MARKINNIADANKWIDKGNVKVIITFRTQQLFDLWENEMSGQISDGMWENSNKTDWLWKNPYLKLGNETKVEVSSIYRVGRKSFGMTKDLWDVIGERIIDENGFKDEKEAKAAWREIAQAIYNVAQTREAMDFSNALEQEKKANARSQRQAILDEWKAVEGIKCGDWDSSYVYASLDFNKHNVTYTDGTVHERHSYLFLYIQTGCTGDLKHRVEWHDTKFYVKPGQLLETIEAIKVFDAKMLELAGTPVNTLF